MADYEYQKMVRRHWYGRFKHRRRILIAFIVVILLAGAWLFIDSSRSNPEINQTSSVQEIQVNNNLNTFKNDLFSFQDSGKWVLSKHESDASKYVYYKYNGLDILSQLIVYVNQVPIPLDLASSRALPVRIVNNDSFDVTSLSGHCIGSYAAGELHKVKIVNVDYTDMLCDPDTPQFTVVLGEINGNYDLSMKRSNGSPVKLVVRYRDMRLQPNSDFVLQVANSFKVL